MKITTPFNVLHQIIENHSPESSKLYTIIDDVYEGRGAFTANFWRWCRTEGFNGKKTGTANADASHGNYLHPEDNKPFRKWLKNKLKEIDII